MLVLEEEVWLPKQDREKAKNAGTRTHVHWSEAVKVQSICTDLTKGSFKFLFVFPKSPNAPSGTLLTVQNTGYKSKSLVTLGRYKNLVQVSETLLEYRSSVTLPYIESTQENRSFL